MSASLRLEAGNGYGVDNVIHGAATRKVVDRSHQSLHDGPHCDALRGLLHSLVGVVPGVQVRENEHRGSAGHFVGRVLDLLRSHFRVHCRVKLDRSVEGHIPLNQIGNDPGSDLRCSRHLLDQRAFVRVTRSVGEHRDAGLNAKLLGSLHGGGSYLPELLSIGLYIDGAVAEEPHPRRQEHEEDTGDYLAAGEAGDQLHRWPHGTGCAVGGTTHHAVADAFAHQHCPKGAHVFQHLLGLHLCDSLLRAQLDNRLNESRNQGGCEVVDDVGLRQVDVLLLGELRDVVRVTEDSEFADAPPHQLTGCDNDASI
mmetsp:Transcript_66944/g.145976  ORF Transcript_66944/g.145976 Transcript_66944/m.145976 type:complete len:311 (+) Transcript_66944:370-1302(+)